MKATTTFVSDSPERTMDLGRQLGARLQVGDVVVLVGDLGAGKTVFVKGVACGAGLEDPAVVTSPTFIFMNAYATRVPIKHYDLYRLERGAEVEALGFDDFRRDSALLLEWGERVPDALLGPHLRIEFETAGETKRVLRFLDRGISPDRMNLR